MTSTTPIRVLRDRAEGERCVWDLVKRVGSSWSTVSRRLSVLKATGLVANEQRGLQVFYRLALPCVTTSMDCLDRAQSQAGAQAPACTCQDN